MNKKDMFSKFLMVFGLGVVLSLATSTLVSCDGNRNQTHRPAPTEGKQEHTSKSLRPAAIDRTSFMPLAIGNTWTYSWHALTKAESRATVKCAQLHTFRGKVMRGRRTYSAMTSHHETYTIVRKVGDGFIFEITIDPSYQVIFARDGRYEGAHLRSLSWSSGAAYGDPGPVLVLTERITRRWSDENQALAGVPVPAPWESSKADREQVYMTRFPQDEHPVDERAIVWLEGAHGEWRSHSVELESSSVRLKCRFRPGKSVTVPAGSFQGCLEVVTEWHEGNVKETPALWSTTCYYVPNVGKVYECQRAADGTLAYEMELVGYQIGAKKHSAPSDASSDVPRTGRNTLQPPDASPSPDHNRAVLYSANQKNEAVIVVGSLLFLCLSQNAYHERLSSGGRYANNINMLRFHRSSSLHAAINAARSQGYTLATRSTRYGYEATAIPDAPNKPTFFVDYFEGDLIEVKQCVGDYRGGEATSFTVRLAEDEEAKARPVLEALDLIAGAQYAYHKAGHSHGPASFNSDRAWHANSLQELLKHGLVDGTLLTGGVLGYSFRTWGNSLGFAIIADPSDNNDNALHFYANDKWIYVWRGEQATFYGFMLRRISAPLSGKY